jgi:hypothetical protein
LTLATTREPKSALLVTSMPLSMIAIAGACGNGPVPGGPDSCCKFDVCRHISAFS